MGHRLSKSPGNRASETITTTTTTATRSTPSLEQQQLGRTLATIGSNRPNSLPPAINLHLQEEPISSSHPRQDLEESLTSSLSSSYSLMNASNTSAASSNSHRQIIIKIQLAKMVNDNETAQQQQQQPQEAVAGEEYGYVGWESSANEAAGSFTSVANNNNNNGNKQEQTSSSTTATATTTTTTYPLISQLSLERESRRRNPAETDEESGVLLRHPGYSAMLEAPEYIDVLEEAEATTTTTATPTTTPTNGNVVATAPATSSVCCRCQKSKRRCCKCTCLVAFRRMLEPSSASSSSSATSSSKNSKANKLLPQERKHSTKAVQLRVAATQRSSVPVTSNQVAIWASDRASMGAVNPTAAATSSPPPFNPQILVVQCPPRTSVVTVASTDDTIHVLATTHACDSNANNTAPATSLVASTGGSTATSLVASTGVSTAANRLPAASQGPIVHSQVDFVHYLVPDLEKITNASYYWGKMDRYEAERLLEGKPEGTFLLRDSAQEEFLFSVTFRKYGRSLHARIEQSGHKFSFDCHDPHVFNALTVTGLLEHYKDPACVMFFEPMLTIPLHRHRPFSLQQLCRATIVSHTSYDGISDMELPSRLKGYLKEYHYKQKLRVKPFDEPFYTTRT